MGKWCNFDTNNDDQLVCLEHSPMGAPALCTHAAADLERRLVTIIKVIQMHQPVGSPPPGDEAMLAAWVLNVLESRLARLELEAQTYAEVAAGLQQEKTRLEEEKALAVKREQVLADEKCRHFYDRAVQAEAREAAMREELAGVIFLMQSHKFSAAAEKLQSVLSPDAGRTP